MINNRLTMHHKGVAAYSDDCHPLDMVLESGRLIFSVARCHFDIDVFVYARVLLKKSYSTIK